MSILNASSSISRPTRYEHFSQLHDFHPSGWHQVVGTVHSKDGYSFSLDVERPDAIKIVRPRFRLAYDQTMKVTVGGVHVRQMAFVLDAKQKSRGFREHGPSLREMKLPQTDTYD